MKISEVELMGVEFENTGISYQQYPKDPQAREQISILDNKVEELKEKVVSKQEVINLEQKVKQSEMDNENKIAGLKTNIDLVEAKVDGLDGGNLEKIVELETTVNQKANKDLVDSLLSQVDSKASTQSVQTLTSQLADTGTKTTENKRALNYYWLAEQQPPARTDKPGWFIDAYSMKPDTTIANYFEPMRTQNPDYITRTSLGKDASNTYDVWCYEFTPKNPKKEIIISTALHGGEVTPVIAMIRFLHYLVNEWEKYPDLAKIREEVKIIYVPFVNPWGVAQSPRKRQNSNGVDLNRNFDYKWSTFTPQQNTPFGHDYKGTSAFSEVESQYIRDLLARYPKAIAYLDMHNTGEPLYDIYVALPEKYTPKTYDKLAAYFTKDKQSPILHLAKGVQPTSFNYAYATYGMPASNPEWCDKVVGVSLYDSNEITATTNWLGNVIIEHVREFSTAEFKSESDSFVKELYFTQGGTALTISSAAANSVAGFDKNYTVPSDGILLFEGFVVVQGNSEGSRAFIVPKLGQTGSTPTFNENLPTRWESYADIAASTRVVIPFQASMPVKKTDGSSVLEVGTGLRAYTGGTGAFNITRYRARVTFIPTKTSNFELTNITI